MPLTVSFISIDLNCDHECNAMVTEDTELSFVWKEFHLLMKHEDFTKGLLMSIFSDPFIPMSNIVKTLVYIVFYMY